MNKLDENKIKKIVELEKELGELTTRLVAAKKEYRCVWASADGAEQAEAHRRRS